jgi:hypothetical protein
VQRLAFDDAVPGRTWTTMGRAAGWLEVERTTGGGELVWRGDASGTVGARIPPQALAFAGGPVTAAGYDFHTFASRALVAQRLEWRRTVGNVPVSLGRYGSLGMAVRLAPFAQLLWSDAPARAGAPTAGWYPGVGIGVISLFDLLRVDVARGFRGGRWTFAVDLSRDLWRVL